MSTVAMAVFGETVLGGSRPDRPEMAEGHGGDGALIDAVVDDRAAGVRVQRVAGVDSAGTVQGVAAACFCLRATVIDGVVCTLRTTRE